MSKKNVETLREPSEHIENKPLKMETPIPKPAKVEAKPKKLPRVGIINLSNMALNATYKGSVVRVNPGQKIKRQFDGTNLKLVKGLKTI